MDTTKHEPAFPSADRGDGFSAAGLTKREHIAALALQGILASEADGSHHTSEGAAKRAVQIADALIDALDTGA